MTMVAVSTASVIAAIVLAKFDGIPTKNQSVLFLLDILYWATCFGAFLTIFLTLKKAKTEREFWQTVNDVENIIEEKLGEDFQCGHFNKTCGWKIIGLLSAFVLCETPLILFMNKSGHEALVRTTVLLFLPKILMQLFMIKYTFFVDVLRVGMRNIELKLEKRKKIQLRV
jgi:hypothetical protein